MKSDIICHVHISLRQTRNVEFKCAEYVGSPIFTTTPFSTPEKNTNKKSAIQRAPKIYPRVKTMLQLDLLHLDA